MSGRDFGDKVPRADVAIMPCRATEAAGMYLAALAAQAGLTSELVLFPRDESDESRTHELKLIAPEHYVVVQCPNEACDAPLTVAAATAIGGTAPAVFESTYFAPGMAEGRRDWLTYVPLELIQPAGPPITEIAL